MEINLKRILRVLVILFATLTLGCSSSPYISDADKTLVSAAICCKNLSSLPYIEVEGKHNQKIEINKDSPVYYINNEKVYFAAYKLQNGVQTISIKSYFNRGPFFSNRVYRPIISFIDSKYNITRTNRTDLVYGNDKSGEYLQLNEIIHEGDKYLIIYTDQDYFGDSFSYRDTPEITLPELSYVAPGFGFYKEGTASKLNEVEYESTGKLYVSFGSEYIDTKKTKRYAEAERINVRGVSIRPPKDSGWLIYDRKPNSLFLTKVPRPDVTSYISLKVVDVSRKPDMDALFTLLKSEMRKEPATKRHKISSVHVNMVNVEGVECVMMDLSSEDTQPTSRLSNTGSMYQQSVTYICPHKTEDTSQVELVFSSRTFEGYDDNYYRERIKYVLSNLIFLTK